MPNKQIEALTKAAKKKKQVTLAKTEKAIKDLIQKKQKITIRSVAREAGVSVSYLYKYPEISARIQKLREQQKSYSIKPQSPTSKSHQRTTTQLRNLIKILEQEKEELQQEITVLRSNISIMGSSDRKLDHVIAENIRLLEDNKKLQKQLENTEQKLLESRDFILNQGYISVSDQIHTSTAATKNKQITPEAKRIFPAILPGQSIVEVSAIDDEIQHLLSELGIKLSKTLIEELKTKPREQIISAIGLVQENIALGVSVKSKVGLLRKALSRYKP